MTQWDSVRQAARGERSDYKLDRKPIGVGGQADVFEATHGPSGIRVAFKRIRNKRSQEATARMRREIEIAKDIDHPNVMPVLDSDPGATWLVMPLAIDNLEARRGIVLAADQVKQVVESVSAGLAAAHERGWTHRDIKPSNVLLLPDPERWVVADWGLVRRPPGMTTADNRTRVGVAYGTEGFAPPELLRNAHLADPSCDVYYVGQLIGWLVTGDWPLQNVPLLPPDGPWRGVVRVATLHEPTRRPQTVADLRRRIDDAFYQAPEPPEVRAEALLQTLATPAGNGAAVDELLVLVESNPDNYELCVDLLPRLTRPQLEDGIRRNPERGYPVLEVLDPSRVSRDWNYRNFRWADQIVYAVLAVATAATKLDDLALLDKAATTLFDWEASWNQFPPHGAIRDWLVGLRGAAAGLVADALIAEPGAARHYEEYAGDTRMDNRIRGAIRRAA